MIMITDEKMEEDDGTTAMQAVKLLDDKGYKILRQLSSDPGRL